MSTACKMAIISVGAVLLVIHVFVVLALSERLKNKPLPLGTEELLIKDNAYVLAMIEELISEVQELLRG